MTYNYYPESINTDDVMKMRFELADTDVSRNGMSAALADEEIAAVLEQYPKNFKMAKLKLLEHMMFKYGQDVDNSVGPVSFDFGNRMNFWKQLYDDLKKEIATSNAGATLKPYKNEKQEYFYIGMMNHPGGGRF
ncbi:hypothetical protein [Anaerostipes sp.]|jgi:hypothetical protein|uniref:hypothetical protein n=1 Tax=Anaerostipes sp. TaxID=1872530 RepID=UPI002E7682DD|nr:hypothetical protein [Anaerostipes sp.]MED9813948.1 hypothetical protein [Anaerostipes sp.]